MIKLTLHQEVSRIDQNITDIQKEEKELTCSEETKPEARLGLPNSLVCPSHKGSDRTGFHHNKQMARSLVDACGEKLHMIVELPGDSFDSLRVVLLSLETSNYFCSQVRMFSFWTKTGGMFLTKQAPSFGIALRIKPIVLS